ncbi:MAG: pyridoxamine 5'-phosphate oxidase family protein [Acidimicrobiia bacterium]|nr:pyridoxamine 5'-phosphate oxidase family protein [Acidimicrobiia bacterium]
MELSELIERSKQYGMWAHVATVSESGRPYVTPVHPCWDGDRLVAMVGTDSTKARNVAANPNVSVHWQVGESTNFDSFIVWGDAVVRDDIDTKRRLWEGVFDYDLGEFAPGGPDDSPTTGFLEITPTKILWLGQFGMAGRETWTARSGG